MAPALRIAIILFFAACLWTQLLLSSALTQEELLRAAIIDFNTTSFELTSDIRLTRNLPPLTLASGKVRVLKIFSKPTSAFTISGAKKYRGFWTPDSIPGAVYPVARLTFDRVQLKDFRAKNSQNNPFGSVTGSGGAIAVVRTLVTVLTCNLAGNQASGFGGAIFIFDGSLVVKDSLFSTNTAGNGGAVEITAFGKAVTMDKTVFLKNVARQGGGLSVDRSALVRISRSTFTGNSGGSGGGIFAFFDSNDQPKSPMLFDSCQFTVNTASSAEGGAAIYINGIEEIYLVKSNAAVSI